MGPNMFDQGATLTWYLVVFLPRALDSPLSLTVCCLGDPSWQAMAADNFISCWDLLSCPCVILVDFRPAPFG